MPYRSGFTLVDLLAAGAAITVAGAVTQPVLMSRKATSMEMSNQGQHQRLAAAQAIFGLDNHDQFAGPNTSGWLSVPGPNQDESLFTFDQSPTTPTSTMDWISPILGDALNLSPNRAQRLQQILANVSDPRNGVYNDLLYTGSGAGSDIEQFRQIVMTQGYKSVSYLSPSTFHDWGTPISGFQPGLGFVNEREEWAAKFGGVPYNNSSTNSGLETPNGYRPRFDQVGTSPANKAMIADGTRYIDAQSSGVFVDIELRPTPNVFGNHLHGNFFFEGETSYGRTSLPSQGQNIFFSIRRPGLTPDINQRAMYISFFDGSTRAVSLGQAKSRPDWWAPTGTVLLTLDNMAPEVQAQYDVGDALP